MPTLHVNKQYGKHHSHSGSPADGRRIVPVEYLSINQHIDHSRAHDAEHHDTAELAEADRKTSAAIIMVRHRNEYNQNGKQQRAHHEIIHVLPFVFVSQPCGKRRTNLSQYHEKQVNGRHADPLLTVELIPSVTIYGLIARRNVAGSFHLERILNERKQVDHHQHHAQKAHDHTAYCQQINAVGLGTHVAQQVQQRETHDTHHLFATDTNQLVEERRKGRHSYGSKETDKLNMFRLNAQPAQHLSAVGRIDSACRKDRDKQQQQDKNTQGLGNPVIKRIIFRTCRHNSSFLLKLKTKLSISYCLALTTTIIPAAKRSLSSFERLVKSIRTGMRC